MKHADLPDRWKTRLAQWKREFSDDHRTALSAYDFPSNYFIELRFEDSSMARFEHALVIEAPAWREVAIFTEHCGYHLFALDSVQVTRIQKHD